ncbi:MAG: response regulator [Verrucomicrobiota bacterium]|nr:response regulator [Verrucomicrobiota bacterium]
MNVLVADDDEITRLLLSSTLRKLGHDVREAQTGAEAWAAWLEERQPLVVSDWMMPDLDGLDFCRRVRAEAGSELTYIILLTARTGKGNYLEGMEAGVDDFIVKPFEREQFAAHIRVATRILALHQNVKAANAGLERRVSERTAELENALQAKSDFLSQASHELRTPMNHVLGFAQLLGLDSLTPNQSDSVQHILSSGRHLLTLIDRILAVSESDPEELSFLETQLPRPERRQKTTSPQRTLLYIEDNPSNAEVVELIIENRPDLKMITAGKGSSGLEMARKRRPALILLDLHLPDINGDQVLTRLKSDPRTAAIPVVMLSADATGKEVERLKKLGACAYVTKPFRVSGLLRVLDETLTPAAASGPSMGVATISPTHAGVLT